MLAPAQFSQSTLECPRVAASPGHSAADRLAAQLGIELPRAQATQAADTGPIHRHRPIHDLTHLQFSPSAR